MASIKKYASLLIVVVVLFESLIPRGLGFSKDFAIGEIVSHYLEHQEEADGDLSFLDFLSLHYASDSDHRDQHPDELPNIDGSTIATFLILQADFGLSLSNLLSFTFLDLNPTSYSNTYCFKFAQDFLHPPIV